MIRRALIGVLTALCMLPVVAVDAEPLPVENLGCGDEVDHSLKLGSDIQAFGTGCDINGLVVTKSGITLDLGGHTIYGDREDDPALVEAGILVQEAKNVTIRNGAVRGFVDGLRAITGNDDSTYEDMVAADNLSHGIAVSGRRTTVRRNVSVSNGNRGISVGFRPLAVGSNLAAGNGDKGIYIDYAVGAEVRKNRSFNNQGDGIEINNADDAVVAGNFVNANGGDGIDVSGDDVRIEANVSATNADVGIQTGGGLRNIVRSNRVIDNGDEGMQSSGNRIRYERNVVSANNLAAIDVSADDVTVFANRVDGNGGGIGVNGARNTIERNMVRGNEGTGIHVTGSKAVVTGNRAIGNGFVVLSSDLGIDASGAPDVTGNNLARVNDDPDNCAPSSLCREIDSGIDAVDLDCGDPVTESVRLTGDVGSSGTPCSLSGLVVMADDIEIDLDGHTIWGDATNDDAENGSEAGIDVNGRDGVRIYDGRIDGFEVGVQVGDLSSVSKDTYASDIEIRDAVQSGFSDFLGGARTRIERSVVMNNGSRGVDIRAAASTVKEVVARGNTIAGIASVGRTTISDSVVAGTDEKGIQLHCCGTPGGAVVKRNTVSDNGEEGIWVGNQAATLTGNVVNDNGTTIPFHDGILVVDDAPGSELEKNVVSFTGGSGINIDADSTAVRSNVVLRSVGSGIRVTGADAKLKSNLVATSTGDGVHIEADGAKVKGNASYANFGEGIDAIVVAGIDIVGNKISGNNAAGIIVDPGTTVVIDGNHALGNGYDTPPPDGVGRGIDASSGATGDNESFGNDQADDCDPPTLC